MRESEKSTYEKREANRQKLQQDAKRKAQLDKAKQRRLDYNLTNDEEKRKKVKPKSNAPRTKEKEVTIPVSSKIDRKPARKDSKLSVAEKKIIKKEEKIKRIQNKEFVRITYAFVFLFLCMISYIAYYQIVKSDEIINSVYNSRQDLMAESVVRGQILDDSGVILAQTLVADDGSETRYYPYGEIFAHAVGYDVLGKSGVELLENFTLLTSNAFFGEILANEFSDTKNIGDNVITTLDASLQEVAYNALGDYAGGVIVMEPDTGKILVMVSTPSYDPNTISDDWSDLSSSEDSELLNRATQSNLVPGSIFKIVTALEYMREYEDYDSYTYTCTGTIELDGTTISCSNGAIHGEQTLEEAFANSCNCAFIDMGLAVDNDALYDTAEELLFNTSLPGEVTSTKASYVLTSESNSAETMMTVMGQGNTLTSPYHMALITCAIANGGKLMTPYIIDSVENYTGSLVTQYSPSSYGTLMTTSEASALSELMEAVIEYGTGTTLSGQSYTVAGKTGTAEYSSVDGESHSWFTGFTNVDNPDIVVTVVVEESDGGLKAIEVAKTIMNAYYN